MPRSNGFNLTDEPPPDYNDETENAVVMSRIHVAPDYEGNNEDKGVRSSDNGKIPSYDDACKPVANGYDNVAHSISKGSMENEVANGNGKAGPSPTTAGKDGKKKEETPKLVSMKQLFRFADKTDVLLMVIGSLCACAHGAALPCMIIIFGSMTQSFVSSGRDAAANPNNTAAFATTLESEIRKTSIWFSCIGFGVLLLAYVQVAAWLTTSHRQSHRVRNALLQAVFRQEIGWFDTHDAGELGSRLSDDVNKIQEGIGDKISNFLQWFATFICGIVIGLVKGWKLALVILSVSPLLAIAGGIMTYLITSTTNSELTAYAKAGSVAEEVLGAIRTVFAYGGQEKECNRYNKNLLHAKQFGIRKGLFAGGGMGATFFFIFGTYALAFWYGGKLIIEENPPYDVGVMLIVFFCVVIGAFALGNAAPNLQNVGVARGAAFMIWDLIDRKSLIDSSSDEGLRPSDLTGNIELKDVSFRYPSRDEVPILNGLSLKIAKGQTVALVGSSGCGKSTVIQLVQRFYDPLGGAVMIDGTDIRELNIKWLRQHIGVVSQEPILFATTIAENIRYGRDGVTEAEIEKAAMEANAHNFISKLPLKYGTLVGERGAQLSGGQKQRIAIARALVRDPRILLLDEATSALDTESEATVQSALDKARHGRTTIVVAHRLSTIKTADLIYGLRDGVVHESGSHAELMAFGGIYHQLVTNQQMIEEEEGTFAAGAHKLERGMSVGDSRASLRRSPSAGVDEVPEVEVVPAKKEEEKLDDVPLSRIMKLNAPEWYIIFFGCIAAIIQGGVQPVFAIIFSKLLGIFGILDQDVMRKEILLYSMMFLLIGGVAAISMFLQSTLFAISGEALTMRMRQMTFKALLRQDVTYFDDHDNSVGAMTTRLATDASAISGATGVRLGMMFQSLASIGTGIIIGFVYCWQLALFIIGFMPFILIAGMLQMKIAKGFSGKNNAALEEAGKLATEGISNMRTVASLTKEPKFLADYEKLTSVPYRQNLVKSHVYGITFSFTQSLIFFAYAAIFTFGAFLIKKEITTYENMFKVFSAIIFGAMAVGQASQFAPDYGKAKSSAARIFNLLDKKPLIDSYSPDGEQPAEVKGVVEFRDVHFSYPTRSTVAVLRGLFLRVEQGQTIALVGSSGCGKSTTVQLLERFYDIPEGQVVVDGRDVKTLNIAWLRAQFGIVSQEPTLFDCSIRENIAYGDNSRSVSMDEIIAAARKANIHSFIESLPQGYETSAGDKGTQLSGGQKQRIAIARALVRNPKILLLDEATSALDTESEKIVQEALDQAQQGRTCLVIAHRLSTIQNASCIVVFHNGCIAEKGTHAELIAQKGLYYKLVLAQGKKK